MQTVQKNGPYPVRGDAHSKFGNGRTSHSSGTGCSSKGVQMSQVKTTVIEILPVSGIVNVKGPNGHLYGLNKSVLGNNFSAVSKGTRILCTIDKDLDRVLLAQLVT